MEEAEKKKRKERKKKRRWLKKWKVDCLFVCLFLCSIAWSLGIRPPPPPFRFVDLKRVSKILVGIDLTVKKWMGDLSFSAFVNSDRSSFVSLRLSTNQVATCKQECDSDSDT